MFVILFRARGRLPPGAPGRPSYKRVGDAPRKIRFSRLETSLGVVKAFFWEIKVCLFLQRHFSIFRYLCVKVFSVPIFQGSQKTLIFIVAIFFPRVFSWVYGCKNAHFSYHSTFLCYLGFAVLFTHEQKPDSSILVSRRSVRDKINFNQDAALVCDWSRLRGARPIALFAPFVYTANENLCSQGILMRV